MTVHVLHSVYLTKGAARQKRLRNTDLEKLFYKRNTLQKQYIAVNTFMNGMYQSNYFIVTFYATF